MKLLVLALTATLLFTAGESVTDSPLNKQPLLLCNGDVCYLFESSLCRNPISAPLSEAFKRHSFHLAADCRESCLRNDSLCGFMHTFNIYLLNQTLLITCKYSLSRDIFLKKLIQYTEATEKEKQ